MDVEARGAGITLLAINLFGMLATLRTTDRCRIVGNLQESSVEQSLQYILWPTAGVFLADQQRFGVHQGQ
jgi:hypothetical protein